VEKRRVARALATLAIIILDFPRSYQPSLDGRTIP
jgi:hypothetical protein